MKIIVQFDGETATIVDPSERVVTLDGQFQARAFQLIGPEETRPPEWESYGIYEIEINPPPKHTFNGEFDGLTPIYEPIPPLPLEEYHKQIKRIRDELIVSGGYKAQGTWFHSDLTSRSQQLGLLRIADQMMSMGAQPTDPFMTPSGPLMWKGMGGTFVTMTPSLAYDIFAAASQQDQLLHAYGEHLINLINEAEDPSEIDIHSGWPETFHSQS